MSTCTTADCDRPAIARGICRYHYQQQYQRPAQPACTVPHCGRPNLARGLCTTHYHRTRPAPLPPRPRRAPGPRPPSSRRIDMAGQRFGTLTVLHPAGPRLWLCLCDCGRTRTVRRRELLRYGDGTSCGDTRKHWRAAVVTYEAAHDRIERDRGRAKEHHCIDCGRPAQHWSYDHTDPDELTSPKGYPYSLDVTRYEPRCVSDHVRFDAARGKPHHRIGAVA